MINDGVLLRWYINGSEICGAGVPICEFTAHATLSGSLVRDCTQPD